MAECNPLPSFVPNDPSLLQVSRQQKLPYHYNISMTTIWAKIAVLTSMGIATLFMSTHGSYRMFLLSCQDDVATPTTTATVAQSESYSTTSATTIALTKPTVIGSDMTTTLASVIPTTSSLPTTLAPSRRHDENDNNQGTQPQLPQGHHGSHNNKTKGNLYTCGCNQGIVPLLLFPDYYHGMDNAATASWNNMSSLTRRTNTTMHDLLYFGMHGTCDDGAIDLDWIVRHFPGKIVLANGEVDGTTEFLLGNDRSTAKNNRIFILSSYPTNGNNIHTSFLVLTFLGVTPRDLWPVLTWHEPPPPALLHNSLVDGDDNDHDWKKKKFAAFLFTYFFK